MTEASPDSLVARDRIGHALEDEDVTYIEPTGTMAALNVRDVWRFRELIYFLTWRDVKVRYKQTALGVAWALLQPVSTVVIFTVLFGRLARFPSDGIPYPIFVLAGVLPWMYFAYVLQQSGSSLVTNSAMISKVYFPRLVLPASTALSGLMDFAITLCLLAGMMVYYHVRPSVDLVLLPLFIIFLVAAALGVGIWLAALNVKYRDVRFILPLITQIGMFLSPVVYSRHLVKGKFAFIYALNPMTGVIEGFRWSILHAGKAPSLPFLLPSIIVTCVLLFTGLFYFRREEKTFADNI